MGVQNAQLRDKNEFTHTSYTIAMEKLVYGLDSVRLEHLHRRPK